MSTSGRSRFRRARARTVLVMVTLVVTSGLPALPALSAPDVAVGTWTATSRLDVARSGHTATLLDGPACEVDPPGLVGQVLVVGGRGGGEDETASSSELYDPATRTWSPTATLATARFEHTASTLLDGRVLVVGGADHSGAPLAAAEVFDPCLFRRRSGGGTARGSWSPTGSLQVPRLGHTASLLNDGRVLVAGGTDHSGAVLASAEVFDHTTGGIGGWRSSAPMTVPRSGHTATVLADGRVLATGGTDQSGQPVAEAEIFYPEAEGGAGSWKPGPSMTTGRSGHTATRLSDGTVLVAGAGSSEVFDPEADEGAGVWRDRVAMGLNRTGHAATLLQGAACHTGGTCGHVMVVGGEDRSGNALVSSELFDPAAGTWTETNRPLFARTSHAAVLLSDGHVLAVGGRDADGVLASAEVFDPASSSQPPSITDVFPRRGSVLGGDPVTITGAGFDEVTAVRFGGALATDVTVASGTRITVTSPPMMMGDQDPLVHVTVATSQGTSARINLDLFRYVARPTVIDVAPEAGPVSGGTEVTITGTNLGFPETEVRFGDDAATKVTVLSETQLTATSPPHASGAVDVSVATPGGVSEPSSLTRFTYDDGTWVQAEPLFTSRYHHTATLLPKGDVLVAGGTMDFQPRTGDGLSSVELYDPPDGWSPAASLNAARHSHTATLLPRENKVLVVGGLGVDPAEPLPEETAIVNTVTLDNSVVHTVINPSTAGPAVRLAQSSSPPSGDAVTPGTQITYNLAYFNTGGAAATTTISELLPAELEFLSATAGGQFDPATRLVTFPPVEVPPGTTATSPAGTVSFSTTVAGVPRNAPLGVIGVVGRAGGFESNAVEHRIYQNQFSTVHVAISADPPSGSTLAADRQITYSLAYFNPGQAAREHVVSDQLPSEVEFLSASDGGTYDARTRTVNFPSVKVPPGTTAADPAGSFTITVRFRRLPEALASAELYDLTTGSWTRTGSLGTARFSHTATLLDGPECQTGTPPNHCGKVLITGGAHDEINGRPPVAPAELYDPATGEWSEAGSIGPTCAGSKMPCGRTNHTATPLPSGKVLVAGGLGSDPSKPVAADSAIDNTASIKSAHANRLTHTVVAPGLRGPAVRVLQSADPPPGSTVVPGEKITYSLAYFNTGSASADDVVISLGLPAEVDFHSATSGGTFDRSTGRVVFPPASVRPGTTAADLAGTFAVTVVVRASRSHPDNGAIRHGTTISSSELHRVHPDGKLTDLKANPVSHTVVTGPEAGAALRIMSSADPLPGSTVTPGTPITYSLSYFNTGQELANNAVVTDVLPIEVEFMSASDGGVFDPGSRTVSFPSVDVEPGTTAANPAGTVTVTVSVKGPIGSLTSAELYDPWTNTWSDTGSLTAGRFAHSSTMLGEAACGDNCGKVLVAGGVERLDPDRPVFSSLAELYDPAKGTWRPAGLLSDGRAGHSATLLADGTVLVAGSSMLFPHPGLPAALHSAEIYQPATGTIRHTLPMNSARGIHTATLLEGPECRAGDPPPTHCGMVLVAGGAGSGTGPTDLSPVPPALDSVELYGPALATPVLGSVVPAKGPSTGGTEVVVTGASFTGVSAVRFGDVAASFRRDSLNQITAVTPPHAKGTVDLRVTTAAGTSGFTEAGEFTYTVSQPPARITDLAVRATSDNDVRLTWSAPASDGSFPPPAGRYIVKQSTSPITNEADFAAARSLCAEGCRYSPGAVGHQLSLSVANLGAGATYHYSIRAVNEIDLTGPMSNAASVVIPARPAALLRPVLPPTVRESQAPNAAPAAPAATESGTPAGRRQSTPAGTTVIAEAPSTAVTEGTAPPESPGVAVLPPDRSSSSPLESAAPIPELTGEEGGFPLPKVLAWVVLMVGLGAVGAFINARYRSGGGSPSSGE